MTIISNNSTTKMSNLAIRRVIRKSVLPLMDIALTLTRMSANMVGQIASRNNDHKREVVVTSKKIITSS
jgi:hypothetical protein